jgi:hypothetical protein
MTPVFVPNSPETDLRRASELISRALNGKPVRLEEFDSSNLANLFFLMELSGRRQGNGSASAIAGRGERVRWGADTDPDWVIPVGDAAAAYRARGKNRRWKTWRPGV